jgi:hemerythrin-like domain-containing protein
MKDLHKDHRNFSSLLKLLTQQLNIVREVKPPDYDLMLSMGLYVENYPDLIHHPKEDVIFNVFIELCEEGRETIEQLITEHKAFKQITQNFRVSIENILTGLTISREEFEKELADFIARQKNHIKTEEGRIFPLIEKVLTDNDWQRIENLIPVKADPLFGGNVQKRYDTLYKNIASII